MGERCAEESSQVQNSIKNNTELLSIDIGKEVGAIDGRFLQNDR